MRPWIRSCENETTWKPASVHCDGGLIKGTTRETFETGVNEDKRTADWPAFIRAAEFEGWCCEPEFNTLTCGTAQQQWHKAHAWHYKHCNSPVTLSTRHEGTCFGNISPYHTGVCHLLPYYSSCLT